jgi:cytochrome P450
MVVSEALATRPDNVPEALVYDFDIHHDPGLLKDPHERVRQLLREAPPLFWTPRNRGHWMALKYQHAAKILREPEFYSSSLISERQKAAVKAMMPPDAHHMIELTPIMMDPPAHAKYRAPLQKAFSPQTMMALKSEIELLANALIDAVIEQGHCDFVPTVTEQLPVRVFLKMMGLPEDRLSEFRALVHELLAPSGDPMVQIGRIRKIAQAMTGVILERRDTPTGDLISVLWSLDIDGEPMTLALMEDFTTLLFVAGLDTVTNGMSFGIRHLAANPQLQAQLRGEPSAIVNVVEELLRRYTFTVTQRRVVNDTELAGQILRADQNVVVYLPANNLDPSEFAEPEIFDERRDHKVHMAFGAGVHRCLGSHLARIELQTLFGVVLERLPEFRIDPDKPAAFYAGMVLAISALPIRWD